jgi:hypothetical protein
MVVEAQTFKEPHGREIAFDDQEVRQDDPMLDEMISNLFVKLPRDTLSTVIRRNEVLKLISNGSDGPIQKASRIAQAADPTIWLSSHATKTL